MSDHVIRSTDDLVEALRAIKAKLELSNDFVDAVGGLTRGHTDKVLGPTRSKNLSPMTLDTFLEVFAVELHMVVNLDAVKRMEARWERITPDRIRLEPNRISAKLIERAKPSVLKGFAKAGNTARNAMLTGEHKTQIARKAAKTRWKKPKKERSNGLKPQIPGNAKEGACRAG